MKHAAVAFLASFLMSVVAGCAGPTQAQRRVSFHEYVTGGGRGVVYIDRLDDPNTCWALVDPEYDYHPRMLVQVDCASHKDVLQEP